MPQRIFTMVLCLHSEHSLWVWDHSSCFCRIFWLGIMSWAHPCRTFATYQVNSSLGLNSYCIEHSYKFSDIPFRVWLLTFEGNATHCREDENGLYNYLFVFIAGNMLHGVGGAAVYVVSAPYLDANVRTENLAVYLGSLSVVIFMYIHKVTAPTVVAYLQKVMHSI